MTASLIDPTLAAQLMAAATSAGATAPEPSPVTATETPEVTIDHDNHADALADILARAKGVRETGEKLVGQYIDKCWQTTKLSKVQAAAQGLTASAHNKAAWSQLQTLRSTMLTAVRKDAREHSHVAPKIASASKSKRSPEVDALLLQHADNPAVQQLAHMLGL